MPLSEVREQFVKLSGRYDLINDDGSDNGADFFLNVGMRMLDRRIDHRKSIASQFYELSANDWFVEFENCRAVQEVWANNGTARVQLEKKTLEELKLLFPGVISATDSGTPLFYCISHLRSEELSSKDSLGAFFMRSKTGSHEEHGVMVLPPPDENLVIEVVGRFYTPKMTDDEDANYWTELHSEMLLKAALYQLETFYRNTEGAKDWLNAIEHELSDLDKDEVLEGMTSSMIMEG